MARAALGPGQTKPNISCNQIVNKVRQSVDVTIGIALFNQDRPGLLVALLAQALPETIKIEAMAFARGERHKANDDPGAQSWGTVEVRRCTLLTSS